MSSLESEIRDEIATAMRNRRMPANDIALAKWGERADLSARLQDLGAPLELLALVGSWGDTMTDEEVLSDLRRFNASGTLFDEVYDETE